MYIMPLKTYQQIYGKLNRLDDIELIHRQTGMDKELLLVMLTQKIVRETRRRYYKVKARIGYLSRLWEAGDSIVKIAEEIRFSPVLLGRMLLSMQGIGKKAYYRMMMNPSTAPTPRLKRELAEVEAADVVYSKWGFDMQVARGKKGEKKLYEWLDAAGIRYKTEADLKKLHYKKTPDALLDSPVVINGHTVRWIDSKATFVDYEEQNRNERRQLDIYVEMFGEGMVIYWFGMLENLKHNPSIYIITDPSEDVKEIKKAIK